MSFNQTNFSCTPMYNQYQNNQVLGYLCSTSSSRNIENFENSNQINKPNDDSSSVPGPIVQTWTAQGAKSGSNNLDSVTKKFYGVDGNATLSKWGATNNSILINSSNIVMAKDIIKYLQSSQSNAFVNTSTGSAVNGTMRPKDNSKSVVFVVVLIKGNDVYYITNPAIGLGNNGALSNTQISVSGTAKNDDQGGRNGGTVGLDDNTLPKFTGSGWSVYVGVMDVSNRSYYSLG
jgi:hypothetical protein